MRWHDLHEAYRQPVLVEEFIDGDELTVGMVGNRPPEVLGIMRVLPRSDRAGPFVYSLEVKRDWQRRVRYECPAQLVGRRHRRRARTRRWPAGRRSAAATWRGSISACATACRISSRPTRCPACRRPRATW